MNTKQMCYHTVNHCELRTSAEYFAGKCVMIAYELVASQKATTFMRYPKVFWTVMRGERLPGAGKGCVYTSRVPGTRLATDDVARLRPCRPGVARFPLEATNISRRR